MKKLNSLFVMKNLTSLFVIINLCALSLAPVVAFGQRGNLPAFGQRVGVPAPPAAAAGTAALAKLRKRADAIRDHYIVVFNEAVAKHEVGGLADALARAHGGTIGFTYQNALRGFSVELSEARAAALSRHPQVAFVEEDVTVEGAGMQTGAPWTLDRLDQREPTLNNSYNYSSDGAGANVYVIDSGIRLTHQEFGGRALFAYDNVGDGRNGTDCFGHGTHIAGSIGGATHGVAKGVKLHAVRVTSCTNASSAARIIGGIDWVTANHVKPAVANLSFATGVGNDGIDLAVRNSIASGVTYVVAAGNNSGDAALRSPARVAEAITVAAIDQYDNQATFSNYGSAVDVYAPGVDMVSTWSTADDATNIKSGTSYAAPLVTGLVARYLAARPGDQPDAVAQYIRNSATPGKVINPGAGSSNLLAFTGFTLSDDFNDNARDTDKWIAPTATDVTVSEVNGRLEITPSATATSYDGYKSAITVDLTDSRISVQASTGQLIGGFGPRFVLVPSDGNNLSFGIGGQNLVMKQDMGGIVTITSVLYDAQQHRHWRIRHNRVDDTINWEVSPDGVTWTVLRSAPRPFSITDLEIVLFAGKWAAETPTTTVTFDNLWHEANPTPAAAIADDFDDNEINPAMWSVFDTASPATVIEQNGRIEVTPAPNTVAWPGLNMPGAFDLRDKTLQVEVQPATQTGSVWTYFKIYLDGYNDYFMFTSGAGHDFYDATTGGVLDRTYTIRDATIRYWRLRHNADANTISFDTSAGGATWTTQKTVAVTFPIHSVWTAIGVGASDTTSAAPGTAIFDNFRLERYRPLFPQSDNFNDNARDAKRWNTLATPDFTVAEQNGRLEITPASTSTNYDGYWAATNIDLTDARISVEGASVPILPNYGSYLILTDGVDYLLFGVGGMFDNLVLQQSVGGVLTQTVLNYNSTQHRFWRIRHNRAADTVVFEASPDGATWTALHTAPRKFSLTNLQTILMVRQYAATSPTGTTIFDNFRIERNEGGKAR